MSKLYSGYERELNLAEEYKRENAPLFVDV